MGKLDVARIAAESGAIAVHVAALLLLLAPMAAPPAPAADEETTIYESIKVPPPPPPPPPETVPVERPAQRVTTPVTQPIAVPPPPVEFTDVTPIDPPPAQVVADVTPVRSTTISEPLTGAHLEYEIAPPPRYPGDAARAGAEGTVVLRVLVGIDGKPLEVSIERSSGNRSLDQAARRQVLSKWRFRAAMQDGRAVQAIGLVPVDFTLNR
ncbi:energy transducer TonB [Lysobacter solisilvae]|uniref:Energy transducer TonB n=2 Tax=Agrilutibacter solisilvae TaxID=2763317 RepID=A0A974Y3J2_9GAMM|nr:energy transducer TonB [Lysobacter solisilvae]